MDQVIETNLDPVDIVIVADGENFSSQHLSTVRQAGAVIAVDGGINRLDAHGLIPDMLIGDLDSAKPAIIEKARQSGVKVVAYPPKKDESDLELALEASKSFVEQGSAKDTQPVRVFVLGLGGGRSDHCFGNVMAIAAFAASNSGRLVEAAFGDSLVTAFSGTHTLTGRLESTVSLFALFGNALGVKTLGLEYSLDYDTLNVGSTRGLSNRLVATTCSIEIGEGMVVAIQPSKFKLVNSAKSGLSEGESL